MGQFCVLTPANHVTQVSEPAVSQNSVLQPARRILCPGERPEPGRYVRRLAGQPFTKLRWA
jgi:hypothetical protein